MLYPDIYEVRTLAKEYNIIPVSMEFYNDMYTPISIFKRIEDNNFCFLLESAEGGEKWARYSFIGRNPFLTIKSYGKETILQYKNEVCEKHQGNPIQILKCIMDKYKGANLTDLPRFNGGAVGYFGYDLIRHYENLPNTPIDDLRLPDSHFTFVDEVIAFDHLNQKIYIIVNLHINKNDKNESIDQEYIKAEQRIQEIWKEITSLKCESDCNSTHYSSTDYTTCYSQTDYTTYYNPADYYSSTKLKSVSNENEVNYSTIMSKEEFCSKVGIAKEYIRNGDIFQVVLSNRLCIETKISPFNIYRALRSINPSPYMFYLKFDDYFIVGASPEMLVRVEGKKVETCPIAGTRKRGLNTDEDEILEKELLSDEKEIAEHTMLVDLARNDIGRVSKFGTVKVKNPIRVEKYSHVMHIVTNIEGELLEDKTPFDALMSVMPAGTLSGAPKIRAMEIIDELETVKRGPYGGAIGYLSFNGNLDSCITIRTIIFKDERAYIQAGAGIVIDSISENEYEETINKATALISAIKKAGGTLWLW